MPVDRGSAALPAPALTLNRAVPAYVRVLGAIAIAALALFSVHSLVRPPAADAQSLVAAAAYAAAFAAAGTMCIARAVHDGSERTAWLVVGVGQLVGAFGSLVQLATTGNAPFPSVTDLAWLSAYALYALGIAALLRVRIGRLRAGPWVDGPVAALATAALAVSFAAEAALGVAGEDLADVAVNISYPVIDLGLLLGLAVVLVHRRGRPRGPWAAIAAAIAAQLVADVVYMSQAAAGTWQPGTIVDSGWALAGVLFGVAAWMRRPATAEPAGADSPLVSAGFTVLALGLLVYDHFHAISDVALGLATVALVGGVLRSATVYARARGESSQKAVLERTASILRAAGDGIYMVDADGVVIYANPATKRTLGYEEGELLGRPMDAAVHHSRADGTPLPSAECPICMTRADGRERRASEDLFWRKDGTSLPVDYTVTPMLEDGAIVGAAIVFRDVTERVRSERDAAATHAVTRVLAGDAPAGEARVAVLRAIGETMGFECGIAWDGGESGAVAPADAWCVSGNGRLAAAVRALGLQPAGSGAPSRAFATGELDWVPGVGDHLPEGVRAGLAARGLRSSLYVPVSTGATRIGVIEFFLRDARRPDTRMLQTLAVLAAQVAEHARRRAAEVEADRMKDDFFTLVSHEFRTPLTSIMGYLDLALEQDCLDPQTRRFLTVVERNSSRLQRLVGDLLFVAQVERGNTALDVGEVDLARIAGESVEAALPRARDAGIELTLDGEPLPPFEGDAGRLAQAVDNLVSNAIKFSPGGGRVRVALHAVDGMARIEVADSGIGIGAEDQKRLFERFFRSSRATERAIQGVGLGLAIVRAILEAHGGWIEVDSAEGAGTTFRAFVPLERAAGRGPAAAPAQLLA